MKVLQTATMIVIALALVAIAISLHDLSGRTTQTVKVNGFVSNSPCYPIGPNYLENSNGERPC